MNAPPKLCVDLPDGMEWEHLDDINARELLTWGRGEALNAVAHELQAEPFGCNYTRMHQALKAWALLDGATRHLYAHDFDPRTAEQLCRG